MALGSSHLDLPAPRRAGTAVPAASRRRIELGSVLRPYVYLLPAVVTLGIFAFWPLAATVYNSFFQWNMVSPRKPVGWENFDRILTDPSFISLLQQSALYVVLALISAFLLPVGLALLTMQVGRTAGAFYQSVLFVPAVISSTVGAIIWQFLYLQRGGPLNAALSAIGLEPQAWLNDPNLALPSLGLVSAWKFLGFNYIIALAGVAGLPREQIEAARIDGAHGWHMLRDVILPLMAPTLLFIGLTAILQALPNVFVPIQLLTVGGPSGSSSNLLYAVYEDAFKFFQIGRSSARSVILVLILGGFAIWQFRLLEKRASYE
ncbi:MAG: sugar ABC transporter permease [Thermomicrobiales bacterium]|nr:sugar ABC transporter permease [Thermomicrobiales bacterium]